MKHRIIPGQIMVCIWNWSFDKKCHHLPNGVISATLYELGIIAEPINFMAF